MEDIDSVAGLPPKAIRKSSSQKSLERDESWRRKPVKKRKNSSSKKSPSESEPTSSSVFSTVGRHSLYSSNKALKHGAGEGGSNSKAATTSSMEGSSAENLDNPKAQSHRRTMSAASLLPSSSSKVALNPFFRPISSVILIKIILNLIAL